MDSVTTTKRPRRTLHLAGRQGPSRASERARATVCRANHSTANATGVMLPAEDPEAPRSWDEFASKLERKFRALLQNLEAMRAELEDAKRRARQFEDTLRRGATWNG